jgi:hypothetical protein
MESTWRATILTYPTVIGFSGLVGVFLLCISLVSGLILGSAAGYSELIFFFPV